MNLFWREMKAARNGLIGWCIGAGLLIVWGMMEYGSFAAGSNSSQTMNEIMGNMPKSLQVIFGSNSLDLSTSSGYFGMLFLYLMLMGTIHALMLGAHIISKEESDKTSEFLMVKPISRAKIISFKLLAALVNITVFNLVISITSIKVVEYYGDGEGAGKEILLMLVGLYLLQLMFLVIGSGIAALTKKPKASASMGTGLLMLTFILSVVVDLNEKLENLKYLSPFKYFEAKNILANKELNPTFVILSIVIIAVFLSVTYIFYRKRDLNV
jgi:ABC-2 type transport system permease protein